MATYKQLLLERLAEDGWEQTESLEIDEWWAEACWRVRSTKQQWGLELFITFLIDPQWDGAHTGEKPPVWAIVATEQLPETRTPTDEVALLSMSKRHFETKLEEFARELATYRNAEGTTKAEDA